MKLYLQRHLFCLNISLFEISILIAFKAISIVENSNYLCLLNNKDCYNKLALVLYIYKFLDNRSKF